jgi:hypothetical protein
MRFSVFAVLCSAAGMAETPVTYQVREFNGEHLNITLDAVRSDGAIARIPLSRSRAVRSLHCPSRQHVEVWDELRYLSTSYLPEFKEIPLPSRRHKADRRSTLVGSETVAGVQAFRYRSEDYEY